MEDVQSYKCPGCGGVLVFSPEINKLHCEACGTDYELDFDTEEQPKAPTFSWINYKKTYDSERETIEGAKTYVCKSCGAEISSDAATAATHCPYCDSEIILTDRVDGALKPNGIIPFKLDSKDLIEKINADTKKKKLLPKDFFSEQKLGKIQGMYVPFWAFDSHLAGSAELEGRRIREYCDSNFKYEETKYYRIQLSSEMSFENVPVDASIKMDNTLMDSIGPYDFSQIEDFDERYLSGYLADRFDDDADNAFPRAVTRMKNTIRDMICAQSYGYSQVSYIQDNIEVTDANVKYLLLPVYLLNMEYKGQKYRFAVNGQTGKMVGELPVSKIKTALWAAGSFLVGAALFVATYLLVIS